jgi:predicted DNA-binding protein
MPVITVALTDKQAFLLELLARGMGVPASVAARQILEEHLDDLDPDDPVLNSFANVRHGSEQSDTAEEAELQQAVDQ